MKKIRESFLEKIFGCCFGAVGVLLLVISLLMAIHTMRFKADAKKVQGVITRISQGTEVEFSLDGQEYTVWLSEYSSLLHVGEEVDLYVDRDNPYHVRMGKLMYLGTYISCIVGAPFLVIGAVFLVIVIKKSSRKKKLMSTGRRVYAEVTGGLMNYNYTVNGRHPYKLECRYTDETTGMTIFCSSGNIWADPELYVGQQVTVWVDPADLSKYYVDVESLLNTDNNVRDYR